jgi:hypothetical protein
MAFRIGGFFIRITNRKDIDGFQIFRKSKFPADNIRLEIANPYRAKSQFRSLKHHVVCQNGGVNITCLLLIKRAHPRLFMVSADDDCQRRTVEVCSLSYLFKSFFALHHNQMHRLEVCGSWSYMGSFQNLIQFFLFHRLICVAAYRETLFCNV